MPRRLLPILLVLVSAAALPAARAAESDGFLYGAVVTTRGDTLTGFLRWEDEEAFWDDLFHSRQVEVPWAEYADLDALHKEERRRYFQTHGLVDRIAWTLENRNRDAELDRLFIARFGDIAVIAIDADENVSVTLNDGSVHPVHGYSNDVRSDIEVHQPDGTEEVFDWDDLREIRFAPAPADAVPYAGRLWGRVASRRGDFEGFIQWDRSECTTVDILDSDQEDLAMGDLVTLRRVPGGNSEAVLADGRTLALSGSNDVGGGNRGVVVQTADQGRVVVDWDVFEQVSFATGRGSGPARGTYRDARPLRGTVTGADGHSWSGRLVYDLDEALYADLLNGESDGLERSIPFALIATITPHGDAGCAVTLRNGTVLELAGGADTGEGHAGMLVWETPDAAPRHLMWADIERISFDP